LLPGCSKWSVTRVVVDGDPHSINAMTPDPSTLIAVNASDCTRDTLLKTHALQRKSIRGKSAALAATATAIPLCFNTVIAAISIRENPALVDRRHLPQRDKY
jgi:hypothetical protein